MIEEFRCLGVQYGPGFNSRLSLGKTCDLHKRGVIARKVARREMRLKQESTEEIKGMNSPLLKEKRAKELWCVRGRCVTYLFAFFFTGRWSDPCQTHACGSGNGSDTNIRTTWEVWFRSPDIKNQTENKQLRSVDAVRSYSEKKTSMQIRLHLVFLSL